jgi:aminomethyltransferase
VREHTELEDLNGQPLGQVTSGLLAPTVDRPIAMGYVRPDAAATGTRVQALVRGKVVPMEVVPLPFVPPRYVRA